MQHSTLENLLVWYARCFPIRRGKLRVINSFWRAAVGNQGALRLADLVHGGLKMRCDMSEMLQRQFYFFGSTFRQKITSGVGRPVHAFERTPEIAARLRETAN
jgi:hypothetical protein